MEKHDNNAQDELQSQVLNELIKLSKRKRILLFFVLAMLNLIINMDHGTIPAASNEIKKDLQIDEAALGTFGSLVYFGNFVGAILLMKYIDKFERKIMLLISFGINALFLYLFTLILNIPFLFLNRIIVGMVQSLITIYMPVWVDQFGPKKWKTMMLSVFNITSPIGVILGFAITVGVKESDLFSVSIPN